METDNATAHAPTDRDREAQARFVEESRARGIELGAAGALDGSQGNIYTSSHGNEERRRMVEGEKLREWKSRNAYRFTLDLNREKDGPIIAKLEALKKQGAATEYIRGLILRDIGE